jgi:cobalt-zinc-cadmium efflux system outer membrane protein
MAEARVKAGEDSELGVSSIRLDAFFSEEQLIRTSRDADLAREKLRFLMGIETTSYEVRLTPTVISPDITGDAEDLVAEALASRPDLRAIAIAVEAACQRARLARYDYFNIWGNLPDINAKGAKGFEAGPGLQFDAPIFNQNQGARARTQAEVERLRRKYAVQRDQVALEVRQACTQLDRARSELVLWREQIVPQAEAAVASARKALEEDGVALLLVQETVRQLLQAQQREIQAAADVRRALAELERSVGRRLLPGPGPFAELEAIAPPEPDDPLETFDPVEELTP